MLFLISLFLGMLKKKKNQGPTEIRTRITGFRVLGANHYTMGPTCFIMQQDPASLFTKSLPFSFLKTKLKTHVKSVAVVAEWLRRLTRNQFPSGSVGSNPTDCDNSFFPSSPTELSHQLGGGNTLLWCASIVGSVVECSPATRAARVRFPDIANSFVN